jgi:TDG/mug DNA glycosylase family protein
VSRAAQLAAREVAMHRDARPDALRRSFPPIARADAELLILGSMPGQASLDAGRYYAHPRNAFWPIVGAVLGFDPAAPYAERVRRLREARVAVWDVLHSCARQGSLDTSIVPESRVANDFAAFFRTHRRVRTVLLNGGMAEASWKRLVAARGVGGGLDVRRMPSTSPANASWSFDRKLAAWRSAIDAALDHAASPG